MKSVIIDLSEISKVNFRRVKCYSEVKSNSYHQGVNPVAFNTPQIIPIHPVVTIQMTNYRLYRGSTLQ